MASLLQRASKGLDQGLTSPRPVLHLSGPKLRSAYERLIAASEPIGGIERFAEAVRLKSVVFQERLAEGKAARFSRAQFDEVVPLMATVRRRAAPLVDGRTWEATHAAIVTLLDSAHDTTTADVRIAAFESALRPAPSAAKDAPKQANSRFLRDLAAELLHNTYPEHYPLMQRWVWDVKSNSGVLREIWHDTKGNTDEVDHVVIDVPDSYETHLMLREELSQFLAQNGVFRDMIWHVDLLCAQVYGDYINAQGGAWLKTDFGSESDPLEHTRRILGLDRVARRKVVSGQASVVSGAIGKDG
jgi:hypothetical protein